jgi:protein-tyrosine phosphatase
MSSPGRMDVHAHLIPAVDDGCATIEQAVDCARTLAESGYTHAFCTPHVWPNRDTVTRQRVIDWTDALAEEFRFAQVPITLLPGGELNLHARVMTLPDEQIIPMANSRYILTDIWADQLPDFFQPTVKWLQQRGLTVILAHPERCRAIQLDESLLDRLADLGVLLQGNLQCISDPPEAPTRRLAEKCLKQGRYVLLGSDSHKPDTMPPRMAGLAKAIELVGEPAVAKLTIENPHDMFAS